jgi:hypothetical protein
MSRIVVPWTWPVNLAALHEAPEGTVTFGYVPDRFGADGAGAVVEFHNCEGAVVGGPLDKRWTIAQIEPLSVLPSIGCHACGLHGFVADGRWIEAA